MYIIRHEKKDLVGKLQTPTNIITSELVSFQVEGTGNISVETSIDDGAIWHTNTNIIGVVAPCYVEVSDCIIGNHMRIVTDGEFELVIINL